jgi:hypothetical protein
MLLPVAVIVIFTILVKNSAFSAISNVMNVLQIPITVRLAEGTENYLPVPAGSDIMTMKILCFVKNVMYHV